jgi:hypothetical protein
MRLLVAPVVVASTAGLFASGRSTALTSSISFSRA